MACCIKHINKYIYIYIYNAYTYVYIYVENVKEMEDNYMLTFIVIYIY